ncbi:uncharacterized protein LOC127279679 [Leptopilina boulardi]|uniref:uncharacterized protein LOC127279679 n=1 Tax=Leptopilina boulardi TaxID=63433 RepID=UPI0021F63C46|nr:uncharacterized protein LOC127279679 [Leptopilina boulardi]
MRLFSLRVAVCFIILSFLAYATEGFPSGDSDAVDINQEKRLWTTQKLIEALENMRQIPQWHCLRYRKFDLVRRCRNYRLARKH